jgi:hypothetical protein
MRLSSSNLLYHTLRLRIASPLLRELHPEELQLMLSLRMQAVKSLQELRDLSQALAFLPLLGAYLQTC